ncbi:MAG: hypothetical protein WCG37_08745 [Actinomycetes bacterium]
MDSNERDVSADDLDDSALRARIVRERLRVAGATAAERAETAVMVKALHSEIASISADRDRWQRRGEAAESENLAMQSARLFRWSATARSLWGRVR